MKEIKKIIKNNRDSILLFKSLKNKTHILYIDMSIDMRFVFSRYVDKTLKELRNSDVIISKGSSKDIEYAKKNNYILYNLDDVAFNNILIEMRQENQKYKDIINKKACIF